MNPIEAFNVGATLHKNEMLELAPLGTTAHAFTTGMLTGIPLAVGLMLSHLGNECVQIIARNPLEYTIACGAVAELMNRITAGYRQAMRNN